jgi:hypothetical protein
MKLNNYLLIVGALGVGAYLAYKKGLFSKKKSVEEIKTGELTDADIQEQSEVDAAKIINKVEEQKANAIENPKSLKSRIAVIQSSLGVTPDGIAGKNTNMALQKKYPSTYKVKGALNASNIDVYSKLLTLKYILKSEAGIKTTKKLVQIVGKKVVPIVKKQTKAPNPFEAGGKYYKV